MKRISASIFFTVFPITCAHPGYLKRKATFKVVHGERLFQILPEVVLFARHDAANNRNATDVRQINVLGKHIDYLTIKLISRHLYLHPPAHGEA